MILREIYLYPDPLDFDENIVDKFRYESRSLCNYISRKIAECNIKTENYKRICFTGTNEKKKLYTNSSNVLIINFLLDINKYIKLDDDVVSKNEFFIEVLESTVNEYINELGGIADIIKSTIILFRSKEYVNSWVQKTGKIQSLGITYSLQCNLSINAFTAHLILIHNGVEFHRDVVLSTLPDEILFSNQIKKVSKKDDTVTITTASGVPVYSINKIEMKKIMYMNNIK